MNYLKQPVRLKFMAYLYNSCNTVIASEARQSHTMESVIWRLPRHFVPRNDESFKRLLGISLIAKGIVTFNAYPFCELLHT